MLMLQTFAVLVRIGLGLLTGWVASHLVGRHQAWGNMLLGMLGALLGGFFAELLFGFDLQSINLGGVVSAVLGAVLFIWAARFSFGRE